MALKVESTMSRPLSEMIGRVVAGRYRLDGLLARGGVGAVYSAEHLPSKTQVAVKMLLPGLADAAHLAERLRREAKAASLLDHPNIVEVLDLVAEQDNLYLVMELVRGRSVGELLDAGPLSVRRALVITRQALEGLSCAHSNGMIHRDIKSENLMLVQVGEAGHEHERVKLLDFGLVKLVGDAVGEVGGAKLTQTGVVFGTPAYIAPEQALGRVVDHRVDLYSLGVVLFEMLTGRTPFRSPDAATLLRMQVSAPIPALASVVPGRPWCTAPLEQLIARSLAKQPDQRFTDATEMIAVLDAAFRSLDHLPAGI